MNEYDGQLSRIYREVRHRTANYAAPRLQAWCDRRAAHEAELARQTSPPATSSPYPLHPAVGAAALTVVASPPTVAIQYKDPKQAVESIHSFMRSHRQVPQVPATGPGLELARQVGELGWYHTIELPHGVVTPGTYDHRALVPHYGLPPSLTGARALDIATADGFWAFEMERRGADVTAVDVTRFADHDFPPPVRSEFLRRGVDRPTGAGFELARRALGSSVRRWEQTIYELSADELGTFDFVHIADVLLHLEHPLEALRRVRALTGGQALITDTIDASMPPGGMRYLGSWDQVTYWLPGLETLAQMVADAGFSSVTVHGLFSLAVTSADAVGPWRVILKAKP
ncbi:MAG TPA: methyltransferase domain-containing protein [Acidimicrobiales bacterium]|nr:methyltransferase domain-containing protein [Acidimicrobiales bacterium]